MKEKTYPPMPKEAFREQPWYHYIHEFLMCGKVELPIGLQGVITAVLGRMGYECSAADDKMDETVVLFGNHERPPFYPDNDAYAKMSIPELILLELGGPEYIMITGCRNFMADGDTLRMNLGRNKSGANLLYITRTSSETYSMRFVRFQRGSVQIDGNGYGFSLPDTTREIENYDGVFGRTLRELFDEVTGYAT